MILSQIAFALGACGGLARILMPSAMNTASKEPVNWPARSLIRNLSEVARWDRSIRTLRAACVVHAPSGLAVMPARWTRRVTGAMEMRAEGLGRRHRVLGGGVGCREVGAWGARNGIGMLLARWGRSTKGSASLDTWCRVSAVRQLSRQRTSR